MKIRVTTSINTVNRFRFTFVCPTWNRLFTGRIFLCSHIGTITYSSATLKLQHSKPLPSG
jgi:hypothetical protein